MPVKRLYVRDYRWCWLLSSVRIEILAASHASLSYQDAGTLEGPLPAQIRSSPQDQDGRWWGQS